MYDYKGTLTRVIDGDTAEADLRVGGPIRWMPTLRFLGVDAPEMKGITRARGIVVRDFVARELMSRELVIFTEKEESLKRWLAVIYLDGLNFNQRMIDEGWAVPWVRKRPRALVTFPTGLSSPIGAGPILAAASSMPRLDPLRATSSALNGSGEAWP